jgi:hypothetical protein
MRVPQLRTTPKFLHICQVLTLWIKELGRVLIFATTCAMILSIILLDKGSNFYTIAFLAIGSLMMLMSIGMEYWLLRKKFDAINRY